MGIFSTLKGLNKKTNSAYNFLKGFNSLLTGDTKTNELEQKVTDSESWILSSGRFMEQNEIMERFHMGNEYGADMSSEVFRSGFEDPTRLMFKVEFGDWGCSVLDTETIKNQQKTSLYNNIYYEDYDQFPMGLLDLNFLEFDNTENWSNQEHYNTYNYLMNRNEDARASYIKTFVQGLYEIQRSMPYLFKKITGLEKLTSFEPGKGVRLKDAKITLECYEGIDLKIRTLLEMYRKAAYDDVWQRWILPDIYRYFKMIIYVFDRRILQTGYKWDKSTGNATAVYSVEQNDFPIYALECGPCEIDIESIWDNEYATAYDEHKDAETKITISVKNVKTYYSNGLMKKIDALDPNQTDHKPNSNVKNTVNWISDFQSISERNDYTSTNADNHANFRTRWMRRMFMMPSEYTAYFDKEITHKVGDNADYDKLYGTADIYGPELPDNSWHEANVRDSLYTISSWKDLKKYLKKVIHSRPVLVRDSRNPDRDQFYNDLQRPYEQSYIYDHEQLLYGPDVVKAQRQMRNRIKVMLLHMLRNTYVVGSNAYYNIIDPGIIDTSATKLEPKIQIIGSDASFGLIDPSIQKNLEKPEHNYIHLNENLDKISQNYTELDENLDKPEYDYITPEFNLEHNDMNYISPEMNLDHNDMNYVKPEFNLDKFKQNYIKPEFNLNKPNQTYVEPEFNLDHSIMDYIKPYMNLDKVDQNYVSPEMNLDKNKHNYVEPEFNLDKSDQNYVSPEMNLDHNDMNYVSPEMNLHKNHHSYVEPEFNLDKADQNYVEPEMNLHKEHHNYVEPEFNLSKTDQNYVSPEMNLDHNDMNYVNPDINDEHNDMNYISPVMNTEHNSMTFVEPQINTEHNSMEYTKPELNTDHNDMNMSNDSTYIDTSKASMNLVTNNINSDHNSMTFIPVSQDVSNSSMTLVNNPQTISKEQHNLQPLEGDARPQAHNQMTTMDMYLSKPTSGLIPTENDTFKSSTLMNNIEITDQTNPTDMIMLNSQQTNPKMNMTSLRQNISITNMDMTSLNQNVSIANMDMTTLISNTSIANGQMLQLIQNSSIANMGMTTLNQNISTANMDMTHLNIDVSTSDMDFIYPITDTSLPDMILTTPNNDVSISNMDMIHLDMNTSTSDMKMTNIDQITENPSMKMTEVISNPSLSDMDMTRLNTDSSIPNMQMTHTEFVDNNPDMSMTELNANEYKTKMVMSKLLKNESIIDMQMTQNINNSSTANIPFISNTSVNEKSEMVMNKPVITDDIPSAMLFDNITDNNDYKPEMKLVNITDDKKLTEKLKALTSIDVNELDNISTEDMLSLADIIESTYDELRSRQKNMKLQDNKPHIPPHKHMKMQSIKQPKRNTYIVDDIHKFQDVDKAAMDRAWQAKQNANSDNKSTGNSGYAI